MAVSISAAIAYQSIFVCIAQFFRIFSSSKSSPVSYMGCMQYSVAAVAQGLLAPLIIMHYFARLSHSRAASGMWAAAAAAVEWELSQPRAVSCSVRAKTIYHQ